MTYEPIFERTDKGVVITTSWPPEFPATREFVETAEPRWLQRHWRTLSFTLANGSAVYRIVSRDPAALYYTLRRVT